MKLIIYNVIVIYLIGSAIIYSLSSCIFGVIVSISNTSSIITLALINLIIIIIILYVPNTDTPVPYIVNKILNTILKLQ